MSNGGLGFVLHNIPVDHVALLLLPQVAHGGGLAVKSVLLNKLCMRVHCVRVVVEEEAHGITPLALGKAQAVNKGMVVDKLRPLIAVL